MKLNSRKVTAYILNTAIFTIFLIIAAFKFQALFENLITTFAYFQIVNTGLFLGANSLDKLSWIKGDYPGGKKNMIDNKRGS